MSLSYLLRLYRRSAVIEWDFDLEVKMFCKRFALIPGANIKDSFVTQRYVDHENEQRQKLGIEVLPLTSNSEMAKEGLQKLRDTLVKQISECYPKLPQQGVEAIANHLCSPESISEIALEMGLSPLVVRPGKANAIHFFPILP